MLLNRYLFTQPFNIHIIYHSRKSETRNFKIGVLRSSNTRCEDSSPKKITFQYRIPHAYYVKENPSHDNTIVPWSCAALQPIIYGTYVFPINHFRSLKLNSRFCSFHDVADADKNSPKNASIRYVPRAIIEKYPATQNQDLLFNLGLDEITGQISTLSSLSRKRKYEEFDSSSLLGLRSDELNPWKRNNVCFDKLQVSHQVISEESLFGHEAHTSELLNQHLKNCILPLNSMKFNFYADFATGEQGKIERIHRLLLFPKNDGISKLESKDGVHGENQSNFQLPANASISHSIDKMLGHTS